MSILGLTIAVIKFVEVQSKFQFIGQSSGNGRIALLGLFNERLCKAAFNSANLKRERAMKHFSYAKAPAAAGAFIQTPY